jgi:hypothetical protein
MPKRRARKRADGLCAIKKDLGAIKKDRTPTHGYADAREAAMAACQELAAGIMKVKDTASINPASSAARS